MKHTTIEIPLYGGMLNLLFTSSYKDVQKYQPEMAAAMTLLDNNDIGMGWSYFTVRENKEKKNRSHYMILLNDFYSKEEIADTIGHEIIHIKNYIFNQIGAKIDTENDEAEAYLVGWITGECFKFFLT